jgi:hypothetical protein
MNIPPDKRNYLANLKARKIFESSAWEARGLIPSDSVKISEMIRLFDTFLRQLSTVIQSNPAEKEVRNTLILGLTSFNTRDYDTEEKEFIADEFQKLAAILGLRIDNNLNDWLYGKVLGTIINLTKKKEVLIESKSFECTKCKLILNLKVTAKNEGVPNYWIISKCAQCGEYNLLSTGPNTGGLKFENFLSVEILNSTETSEEQAKTRLEQIKYFRK